MTTTDFSVRVNGDSAYIKLSIMDPIDKWNTVFLSKFIWPKITEIMPKMSAYLLNGVSTETAVNITSSYKVSTLIRDRSLF